MFSLFRKIFIHTLKSILNLYPIKLNLQSLISSQGYLKKEHMWITCLIKDVTLYSKNLYLAKIKLCTRGILVICVCTSRIEVVTPPSLHGVIGIGMCTSQVKCTNNFAVFYLFRDQKWCVHFLGRSVHAQKSLYRVLASIFCLALKK